MAVGPDALQAYYAAPGGFQLHQRRPEPGAVVAETAQQLIAGHGAAQLGPRQPPAGDDEFVTVQRFPAALQTEPCGDFLHFFDFQPGFYRDIRLFQGKPQYVHHGICLIGIGIDPAGRLRHGEKAHAVKPA